MGPILLTGGSGQVGGAILRLAPTGMAIHAPGRAELDLTDPSALSAVVRAQPWSAVVNCAAYTAVDRAETDVAAAWLINAMAPAVLAEATAVARIPIVHVSTDYVFDGSSQRYYREDDPVAPLGVYGASKLGGELAIRTGNLSHVILRTAWVVSTTGTNFIRTMLRLGTERPRLRVVADQHGCPTSADDIARAILAILEQIESERFGTYHFVNAGEASWHELAQAVFARAALHGRAPPIVEPIATSEYPTPARRPANSRLATTRLTADYGIVPRDWHDAVNEIVDTLVKEAA